MRAWCVGEPVGKHATQEEAMFSSTRRRTALDRRNITLTDVNSALESSRQAGI
jgi:hypothetical protein